MRLHYKYFQWHCGGILFNLITKWHLKNDIVVEIVSFYKHFIYLKYDYFIIWLNERQQQYSFQNLNYCLFSSNSYKSHVPYFICWHFCRQPSTLPFDLIDEIVLHNKYWNTLWLLPFVFGDHSAVLII